MAVIADWCASLFVSVCVALSERRERVPLAPPHRMNSPFHHIEVQCSPGVLVARTGRPSVTEYTCTMPSSVQTARDLLSELKRQEQTDLSETRFSAIFSMDCSSHRLMLPSAHPDTTSVPVASTSTLVSSQSWSRSPSI